MEVIEGLSSDYKQKFDIRLNDGSSVSCFLEFYPNQLGWYINFSYKNIIVNTPLRMTVCQNLIREYRDILPFGLGCSTVDGGEIMYVDDFVSGRARLLLLDENDIKEVEDSVYGKV